MPGMNPQMYDSPDEDSDVSLDTGTPVDQQSETYILRKTKLRNQICLRNAARANRWTVFAQQNQIQTQ
jgi:hypothetical protein